MAKNITSDTDKSSSINKRVKEDGTLIREVRNIESFINKSGDKTFTNSSKSTKSFFRTIMVRNHTIKATKCSLGVNSKMTQIHLLNNVPSVKDNKTYK